MVHYCASSQFAKNILYAKIKGELLIKWQT